ncbi:MAG TPA: hypothetical protein PK283_06940 [Thiotrichales bacterium]|jgi:hypothetical protein|nr:MAG: hypothetical protein B7X85_07430 [Thiotrichales bacterium 17-46-47]HQR82626.1 hypothetical protein [Thiotrichales bacterium]HQR96449.1 hypothetical protein [Thiotrichales bacterium]HQT04133.1 hypothetical protein [Thiotrichales bacterium]
MYSIAFETDIVSEFLRIPNFEQFKNKHVRVVIEEELAPTVAEKEEMDLFFNDFKIDMSGYTFDRNEANAR